MMNHSRFLQPEQVFFVVFDDFVFVAVEIHFFFKLDDLFQVPSQVSHVEFWRRYFYKLHQIQIDQARKEALMKRAEKSRTDDSLSWEGKASSADIHET